MCHRNLNIRYIFLTKIKSFSYRNHSYLYSPFNMGVNVFQNHLICEYLTWQLIPATIYSQGQPCSYKTCSGKPPRGGGLRWLSLCLLLQRPRGPKKGAALAGPLRPWPGLGGQRWAEPPGSSEDAPGRSHTCPPCPCEPRHWGSRETSGGSDSGSKKCSSSN